jgi:hypothetical protein
VNASHGKTGLALLGAALVFASIAPVSADPLRHLDYRVNLSGQGAPRSGTVHLDLIATRGEGAVVVEVAEEIRDADAGAVRVDINRSGGIATRSDQILSHSELALLGILALESENLNGVDVGGRWQRSTRVPGGRCSSTFKITRNDGQGHVRIAVTRSIDFADGEHSSWRGNVEYDANAFVPTSIAFTGTVGAHPISVNLRLVTDTFADRTGIGRHEAAQR